MNSRRSFLKQMLRAGVAAVVLPSALTYTRKWVAKEGLIVPLGVTSRELLAEESLGVLNAGLILQRNLRYLKNKMDFMWKIDPKNLGKEMPIQRFIGRTTRHITEGP